jgi:hypothetical protein
MTTAFRGRVGTAAGWLPWRGSHAFEPRSTAPSRNWSRRAPSGSRPTSRGRRPDECPTATSTPSPARSRPLDAPRRSPRASHADDQEVVDELAQLRVAVAAVDEGGDRGSPARLVESAGQLPEHSLKLRAQRAAVLGRCDRLEQALEGRAERVSSADVVHAGSLRRYLDGHACGTDSMSGPQSAGWPPGATRGRGRHAQVKPRLGSPPAFLDTIRYATVSFQSSETTQGQHTYHNSAPKE